MQSYDETRQKYKPEHIKMLLIAESPPPAAEIPSSRHFYRTGKAYPEDRLFINTIRAIYPETMDASQTELQEQKEHWLRKFQHDGWYMIEALEDSQEHEVTKQQRQQKIRQSLPRLIERVKTIAEPGTKIILIKSNVFDVAAEPLRNAGFIVLNKELVDYPGRFNQKAYREKLSKLATA